jgi:hypothetical protein
MESSRILTSTITLQNKTNAADLSVEANIIRAATAFIILVR